MLSQQKKREKLTSFPAEIGCFHSWFWMCLLLITDPPIPTCPSMPDAALHTVQEHTIPAVLSTVPSVLGLMHDFPYWSPSHASYHTLYRLTLFPTEKKLKKIAHGQSGRVCPVASHASREYNNHHCASKVKGHLPVSLPETYLPPYSSTIIQQVDSVID